MSNVIQDLERAQLRNVPRFKAGDTVRVHFQVIEGTRRRVQVFEGIVLKRQGAGARETFTVRKQSFGVGVERTFPLHSPKIEKIEVAAIGDVNRAKLYYLRGRVGKKARVRERRYGAGSELPVAAEAAPADTEDASRAAVEAEDAEGPRARGRARRVEAEPVDEEPAEAEEPTAEEAPVDEPGEDVPADEGSNALSPKPLRSARARHRGVTTSRNLRRRDPRRPRTPISSPRGETDRPEAPALRSSPRRALRRRRGRGGARLPRRPARRGGRPARLRLAARPSCPAARLPQRLEAVLAGAARGSLPRRRRLRGARRRACDPGRRDRPQRPASFESRRPADDARGADASGRGLPRRRLPARAGRARAHRRRRRRREERSDCRGLDRREGRRATA